MIRFPSKTFIVGEYAVLREEPGLVLAHSPWFTIWAPGETGDADSRKGFHPDSPAGRIAAAGGLDPSKFSFLNPLSVSGGFGASGAEFLAAYAAIHGLVLPWKAWEAYRALGVAGSGVDLLAQAAAQKEKTNFIFIDIASRELDVLYPPTPLNIDLFLFHTCRKLPTHEHLSSCKFNLPGAASLVNEVRSALLAGDRAGFTRGVSAYGALLEAENLVAEHTKAALRTLSSIPAALAAKGCGAMGSDVLLVVAEKATNLKEWAKEHSLVEVASIPI